MVTTGQINREAIIRVEGEIKLLKQEIQTIRGNHLAHLEMRVSRMEKVMWTICLIAATHLLYSLLQ
tara:strand:+ start:221 stop:418 length:198 start_codon:yes stop_codon:yes gene_type:complete